MIDILLISNPYDPRRSAERISMEWNGGTIRDWLRHHYGPDFVEFPQATVCQLNGRPMPRREWDCPLEDGDHLMFVTLPQGVVAIVLAVVSIAIAVAVYMLLGDPRIPAEMAASDSVYTLRGQNNRFRPGEPIEVAYGRCRIWPTYLTRPYSRYVGNQQYQYSLFCLGQGDFTVHGTYIDDTPTSRFDEIEVELCPPGTPVTLVESAVYPSLEVSNIELLGPNEDGYDGFSGPFTVNEFANPVRRLEIDINFPSGLYSLNDKGKISNASVELLFEYREVNEGGTPIGSWETLANPTITRAANTPQRFTYTKGGLDPGRYQVRGRRVTNRPDGAKTVTQVRWEAAKGYARLPNNFGNVFIIAMKAKATNQLNDQSSRSFNVRATRKLPIWNGSTWSAPTATRNPIWAFCDIMRSTYGARLATQYLDMPKLLSLASTFESRNDWFDWVFDQPLTVWEAAKLALRVGRATPIPQGSLITAVRDEAQENVVAVFNQHNIVKGSLSKELSLFSFQPFDGILVEYTDQDSWKPETVKAVLPGRAGTNLERVKLPGCTNRNRALREGLYLQSRREYQRKTVTFRTGMEGYIPVFMDLVAVSHDTVRVGQGGMVLDYDADSKTMTLSEQVAFGPANLQHVIALRADDGGILGSPIPVTPGPFPNQVVLAEDPDEELDFGKDRVPPLYSFGLADLWTFKGKVASVRPVDFQTIEIAVVNYVDDSYSHDDDEAVPVVEIPVIANPDDPEVGWVEVTGIVDNAALVNVAWEPVAGAAAYVVQIRYGDDETWTEVGTFSLTTITIPAETGVLYARVAPFSPTGNVIWTESEGFTVGSTVTPPAAPGETAQDPFVGLSATVKWVPLADAWGYDVEVWQPGGTEALRTENVGSASSYVYSRAMFEEDEPAENGRTLEFRISGYNAGGNGATRIVELTNTLPAAPTGFLVGSPTGDDYPVAWDENEEEDFSHYRVYASTSPGFEPGDATLVDEPETASSIVEATATTYWRVGVVDVWGGETVGPEQEITV